MTDRPASIDQLRDIERQLRTPEGVAELFCNLDDDGQARFFSAVAAIFESWTGKPGSFGGWWQTQAIADHMKTCTCGTDGRAWIEDLHGRLQTATGHHDAPSADQGTVEP